MKVTLISVFSSAHSVKQIRDDLVCSELAVMKNVMQTPPPALRIRVFAGSGVYEGSDPGPVLI